MRRSFEPFSFRFKAVRLPDEESLLVCAAYVDLNLELLDWTARLKLSPSTWCELVRDLGRLFSMVAGHPRTVDGSRSRHRRRRFHLTPRVRELLPIER